MMYVGEKPELAVDEWRITSRIDSVTKIPQDYLTERPPCPTTVKIELTGRCNYRCGFCALTKRDKQPTKHEDMDLDFFKNITRQMYESGVREIGLFYIGESFMVPDLLADACRYLKKDLGMPYVFLTTNGSLVGERAVHAVMDAGLDSLKFSITSSGPEQFEEVVGVKQKMYHNALENLKRAYEIRNRCKYKTKIYASSIKYDGEQMQKMESIVKQHIEPFVDEHYYLPMYSFGDGATERELELGYTPTAGNQGRIGGLVDPLPCWVAFTEGHVRHNGGVSFCGFDADGRFEVGNLHDDTWMDLWNNDEFAEIRAAHLRKDVTGTKCETCAAYDTAA